MVVVSLGVAMIIVDSTIVNVALPAIIRELSITSTDAQWVQESYTLVFAALLLSFGRLADRYGRRLLFLAGLLVFIVASVLAALGQNGPELIGARILQGIGGAAMLPTSLSIINAEFRGRDRGIAFAVWGSTIGGTAALGPLLGGWLTTSFSWRWAFGINVPLGVLVIVGLLLLVGESKGADVRPGVDLGGALLSIVGFGGVVFALIEGRNYGWWGSLKPFSLPGLPWPSGVSPVPVSLAVGVLALVLFVVVELRRNRADQVVILDLQLFTITSFRNGNVAAAVVSLGEFGLLFSLPLWFQNVRGYSAFETGLALLPLAVGSFAASGLGAQVGARRGAAFVVRLGIVLEIVGIAAIGLFARADSAWWVTVPCLFVYGMGVGLATAQLTGVVLVDVPVAQSGQGSATQSTSRQLGSALGIAILGTVLFTSLGSNLTSALDGAPGLPGGQGSQLVAAVVDSAGAAIPSLGANPATAAVADAARVAFTDATRATAWVAVAFLLLGLAVSFSLGRTPGQHED
ncbi:MFS transporter [Lapillicoccus sp.]|uniref:MFS transporter n=1 Tax=Lapillicoccus sp. TaxID=1909287 RepID=UPI0032649148